MEIPHAHLRALKRHYEGVQRLMTDRMRILVERGEKTPGQALPEDQRAELQTLAALIAPMDKMSEDINALVFWLLDRKNS